MSRQQLKVTDFFSTTKKKKVNKGINEKSNIIPTQETKTTTSKVSCKTQLFSTPSSSVSKPSSAISTPSSSNLLIQKLPPSLIQPKSLLTPRKPLLKPQIQTTLNYKSVKPQIQHKRKLNPTSLSEIFENEAKKQKNDKTTKPLVSPFKEIIRIEPIKSVKKSTEKSPKKSPRKSLFQLSNELAHSPEKILKGPLKGVSIGLLQKIRDKEALAKTKNVNEKKDNKKKLEMIWRLPEFIHIIHSHFVGEKKIAISFENLVFKCRESYHTAIAIRDVEALIKLLIELLPKWIVQIDNSNGVFIKIDKTILISDLIVELNSHAKSLDT